MKSPAGMTPAGRRGFQRAVKALGEDRAAERLEAVERYARLCELADQLRREWVEAGRPATTLGGATGQVVSPHPLPKMIRDAERDAAAAWEQMGLEPKKAVGRPRAATSAPDRPSTAEPPRLRVAR